MNARILEKRRPYHHLAAVDALLVVDVRRELQTSSHSYRCQNCMSSAQSLKTPLVRIRNGTGYDTKVGWVELEAPESAVKDLRTHLVHNIGLELHIVWSLQALDLVVDDTGYKLEMPVSFEVWGIPSQARMSGM